MTTTQNTPPTLSEVVRCELLGDLERTNLPFSQISLVDICDAKVAIYGKPGRGRNSLWRSVQKYYDSLRNLQPLNYRRLLDRYIITPGAYTFKCLKESEKTDSDAASLPIEENNEDEDKGDEDDDENTDEEHILDLGNKLKVVSFNTPPEMEHTTPNQSETTPGCSFSSPPSSNRKMQLPMLMRSPPIAFLYMSASENAGYVQIEPPLGDEAYQVLDFFRQNGTKEYPTIIVANPEFPERNGIFYTSHFSEKEVDHVSYNGYSVSLVAIDRVIIPSFRLLTD